MKIQEIIGQVQSLWPNKVEASFDMLSGVAEIRCERDQIPGVCDWLFNKQGYHFSGLVVEENKTRLDLFYIFVGQGESGRIHVRTGAPLEERRFKSVSTLVHAADWHEREAEDLFGLAFEGHPRLGDFILHDDIWPESVEPMRKGFNPTTALTDRKPRHDWRPRRIVNAPGAFIMSIGPVFSGEAESVHFQLETTGEEIFRVFPRLFFKYRGVEKMAEGRTVNDVLLLAERFAGTTAFSHALAYCMAVEQICKAEVPERAKILRLFLAELERLRHHIGVIESICNSTGLAVAASQTAALEEKALRLTAKLTGHRYLFGMAVPGGLSRDLDNGSLLSVIKDTNVIVRHLEDIYSLLINTSSFLDRIEEVGIVTGHQARNHGLVGPVARGSGCSNDIRKLQPYCAYDKFEFVAPEEQEGDGYARLRIFFTEAKQSAHIMEQAGGALVGGPVFSPCNIVPGVAAAGVEAPRGASWHWVSIGEDGKLKRYRLITPSFTNWHGFHLAVENYTFQDFPIILATFGLSVAESDR